MSYQSTPCLLIYEYCYRQTHGLPALRYLEWSADELMPIQLLTKATEFCSALIALGVWLRLAFSEYCHRRKQVEGVALLISEDLKNISKLVWVFRKTICRSVPSEAESNRGSQADLRFYKPCTNFCLFTAPQSWVSSLDLILRLHCALTNLFPGPYVPPGAFSLSSQQLNCKMPARPDVTPGVSWSLWHSGKHAYWLVHSNIFWLVVVMNIYKRTWCYHGGTRL